MGLAIPPWVQTVGFGFVTALGVVAAFKPEMFPSFISGSVAADTIKTCGDLSLILGPVGVATGLFSSSKPGPFAPQDPAVVVAATHLASLPPDASPVAFSEAKANLASAASAHG
jgi:hypothetical protein